LPNEFAKTWKPSNHCSDICFILEHSLTAYILLFFFSSYRDMQRKGGEDATMLCAGREVEAFQIDIKEQSKGSASRQRLSEREQERVRDG